ncbi:uncharacterized protein LOC117102906 [Anneissia japonica]|uniref:uncharacterized protein LOC117102906 n=1 Tax=Anneissia japonica TaxID=1529436 RepID=UPI001425A59B|nr:uncharacterized protein LOC117102906 [Anneissia japonica]
MAERTSNRIYFKYFCTFVYFTGCKHLTDDEQSRLALLFANCHLQKAQIPPYHCDDGEDISDCLAKMRSDVIAFNAYTEFFTHTQNICFFLQNQIWHERTEDTVSRLATSSESVAEQLETTSELQDKMMQRQSQSLANQEAIIKNEKYLQMALHQSSQDLQQVFNDMKISTKEQKQLFEETFQRVSDVQRVILGEFTSFHSLLFYVLAAAVVYMLTSTSRSSGARLYIFVILIINAAVERAIFYYSLNVGQDILYQRMWMSRKLFCTIATVMWMAFIYLYRDYNKINNKLLLKIEQDTAELRKDFQRFSTNSLPNLPGIEAPSLQRFASSSSTRTMVPTITSNTSFCHPINYTHTDSCPNTPEGPGVQNKDMDDTLELDYTYIPSDSDNDSDDTTSSFFTADQSMEDLRRSSSSFLDGRPILNLSRISDFVSETSNFISGKKTSSMRNYPTPESTSRYNLRSRSRNNRQNPVLESETPEMFTRFLEMRQRLLQEGRRQINSQQPRSPYTPN